MIFTIAQAEKIEYPGSGWYNTVLLFSRETTEIPPKQTLRTKTDSMSIQ